MPPAEIITNLSDKYGLLGLAIGITIFAMGIIWLEHRVSQKLLKEAYEKALEIQSVAASTYANHVTSALENQRVAMEKHEERAAQRYSEDRTTQQEIAGILRQQQEILTRLEERTRR